MFLLKHLTLNLLTWRIWWAPNNASKWQMGFNPAFKGLKTLQHVSIIIQIIFRELLFSLLKSLILKFVKNVKSQCGDAAA